MAVRTSAALSLLVTEGVRGGYEVFAWVGSRARSVKYGPSGFGRSLRDLNEAVVEALALDVIDPATGEGVAPNLSSANLNSIQALINNRQDALVSLDRRTGKYSVSAATPPMATASDKFRHLAIRIASEDPELAFDLVNAADGPMEARVALRWAMEHSSPQALKEYLKEHPDADKSKHTVKKPEKGESKDNGKDKKPAAKRPSEAPEYKGADVTKWSQKEHQEFTKELAKKPMDELLGRQSLIEIEEKQAKGKKVEELSLKKLHIDRAIALKKKEDKGK